MADASQSEYFKIEIEEGVARCSMNGPTMNAMGIETLPPMMEGLGRVLDDDEVRVIVIRGEGDHFSVGADLSIMGEKMDPILLKDAMQAMGAIIYELHEGPKPVIAEVDGWAVGGAFGLAMSSDITYVTERANLYLSFVHISLIPDFGGAYFLARRVGLAQAKEIALTGKIINAEEALRLGLVNRVVPHKEISDAVMKVAKKMAARSPNILAMTKHLLNVAPKMDLRTMLDMEAYMQPINVLAPEHQRDVKDFLARHGLGQADKAGG
jgi:2-(1,2-epoxy-1,2-dihydrophenyl)acetyl-CoA isomerase